MPTFSEFERLRRPNQINKSLGLLAAAGVRRVDLPDALRRELAAHGLHREGGAEGPMFPNREGGEREAGRL